MIFSALVDAGANILQLQNELATLCVDHKLLLRHHRIQEGEVSATRIEVVLDPRPNVMAHRHFSDITEIIEASRLTRSCKDTTSSIFRHLATAEARVHGTTVDDVHLHEVGAMDSIVDVAGTVCAFEQLEIRIVFTSPVAVGSGTVRCSHGTIPVPVPAVVELLRDYPTTAGPVCEELCTPTGAAIIRSLSSGVRSGLSTTHMITGHGAGSRYFGRKGGFLRIMIGEEEPQVLPV